MQGYGEVVSCFEVYSADVCILRFRIHGAEGGPAFALLRRGYGETECFSHYHSLACVLKISNFTAEGGNRPSSQIAIYQSLICSAEI